jgi:hypothetical protein
MTITGSAITNTATAGLPSDTDDKPYSFAVTAQTFINPANAPTDAYIECQINGSLMTNAATSTYGHNYLGFALADELQDLSAWDNTRYASSEGIWAMSFGQRISNSKQIAVFADGAQRAFVAKPQTVESVSTANNTLTITSHPFTTGDPVKVTTTGSFPSGLTGSFTYYVASIDGNTIGLALTPADAAIANTVAIDTVGSGTISVNPFDVFRVERDGLTGTVELKRNGTVIHTYAATTTLTLRGFYTSREAMDAADPVFSAIKVYGGI